MNQIDDATMRFYFKRRTLIDEWSTLPDREPALVDEFLRSLEPDVQAMVEDLGSDLWVVNQTITNQNVLGLRRETWASTPHPAAVIGIGWNRRVRFVGGPDDTPWIGVRMRRSEPWTAAHDRTRLSLEGVDELSEHAASAKPTHNWVGWIPVSCAEVDNADSYWEDLSPFRAVLLDRLRESWQAISPLVDAAFAEGDGP